jgi:hypothetical protein
MRQIGTALALLLAVFVCTPASAADAWGVQVTPSTLVNQGTGWKRFSPLRQLRAGDQVIAQGEDSSGWIIYCGCDEYLEPGRVHTVKNRKCKVESVDIRRSGLPHIVTYPDGERGEEELTRCKVPAWWLLAGAGGAVGVCALAGCFDDDDGPKKPRAMSP